MSPFNKEAPIPSEPFYELIRSLELAYEHGLTERSRLYLSENDLFINSAQAVIDDTFKIILSTESIRCLIPQKKVSETEFKKFRQLRELYFGGSYSYEASEGIVTLSIKDASKRITINTKATPYGGESVHKEFGHINKASDKLALLTASLMIAPADIFHDVGKRGIIVGQKVSGENHEPEYVLALPANMIQEILGLNNDTLVIVSDVRSDLISEINGILKESSTSKPIGFFIG